MAAIRRRRFTARLEITAAVVALATDLLSPIAISAEEELLALLDAEERTKRTTRQVSAAAVLIARLAAFEAQIQAQREHLARGGGWFELHYVTHERLNVPALRDAKATGQQRDVHHAQVWTVPRISVTRGQGTEVFGVSGRRAHRGA